MIKVLFVCRGNILKSPGKVSKINDFMGTIERLLHHCYTIYIWVRALMC